MAEVHPFHGITYNSSKVAVESVVSPPYQLAFRDVRRDLLRAEPRNAVQFIVGADAAEYRASAAQFSTMLREGVVTRDDEPSFYVIAQSYKDPTGAIRQRMGVIGLCRLEDFSSGDIVPHLKTIPRIREDRFRQIQIMNANTSPVRATCDNNSEAFAAVLRSAMAEKQWGEITLENSIVRMWKIRDRAFAQNVIDALRGTSLTIVEGHHSYEAALAYRDMMLLGHPGPDEAFNYIMMCIEESLSDATILAVHRTVTPPKPVDWERAALQIVRHFKLRPVESIEQMHLAFAKRTRHMFGMIRNSGMWLCALVDSSRIEELVGERVPAETRHTGVVLLHSFFLEHVLGMDVHDQMRLDCVQYAYSMDEAMTAVEEEKTEVAFILPPVSPDEIASAVKGGSLLPPRATWFFPPLPSGLVMRRIDERVR